MSSMSMKMIGLETDYGHALGGCPHGDIHHFHVLDVHTV